jgi:hypothetical protein
MSRDEYLFTDGDLRATLEVERTKLAAAANGLPADEVLSKGVEALATQLVERFRVEPLEVDWTSANVSHADAQVDVSRDPLRAIFDQSRPFYVPGTTITYHVPFRGDANLFNLHPSRFTLNPPLGTVHGDELRIEFTLPVPLRDTVRADLDREITQIKNYIGWVNSDVAGYNAGLDAAARAAVMRRRDKVVADHELIASLGVPVRRKEDAAPTYAVPPVRRTVKYPAVAGASARPPEPVLPAETYEEILSIIRNMALVFERSPKAFAGMDEEDLRQHFLVQLNGQYEGNATGETFNFDGKTDILIRHKGRNTFIGECKFWAGPKKLSETIDQILRYTSWRDTKTAILVFNRERELSRVLAQIAPTVSAHPNFVRDVPYGDETSFRFVLRHRDDASRELTLTVVVFEVPA